MDEDALRGLNESLKLEGFFPNIPIGLYHRAPGYSASSLKFIRDYSLALYHSQKSRPEPATPSMLLGSAVHIAVLEPHLFKSQVTFIPDAIRGRARDAKEARALFARAHADKIVLDGREQYEAIPEIVRALLEFIAASDVPDLLTGGVAELSCFYRDKETGVLFRVRPDYFHQDRGIAVNLKTAESVLADDLARACRDYGYFMASALYVDVLSSVSGMPFSEVHIFVEPEYPYRCSMRYFADEELNDGRAEYRALAQHIANATGTGGWPALQPLSGRRRF